MQLQLPQKVKVESLQQKVLLEKRCRAYNFFIFEKLHGKFQLATARSQIRSPKIVFFLPVFPKAVKTVLSNTTALWCDTCRIAKLHQMQPKTTSSINRIHQNMHIKLLMRKKCVMGIKEIFHEVSMLKRIKFDLMLIVPICLNTSNNNKEKKI